MELIACLKPETLLNVVSSDGSLEYTLATAKKKYTLWKMAPVVYRACFRLSRPSITSQDLEADSHFYQVKPGQNASNGAAHVNKDFGMRFACVILIESAYQLRNARFRFSAGFTKAADKDTCSEAPGHRQRRGFAERKYPRRR